MEPLLHLGLQGGTKTIAVQQEGKDGKRKQRQRDNYHRRNQDFSGVRHDDHPLTKIIRAFEWHMPLQPDAVR